MQHEAQKPEVGEGIITKVGPILDIFNYPTLHFTDSVKFVVAEGSALSLIDIFLRGNRFFGNRFFCV